MDKGMKNNMKKKIMATMLSLCILAAGCTTSVDPPKSESVWFDGHAGSPEEYAEWLAQQEEASADGTSAGNPEGASGSEGGEAVAAADKKDSTGKYLLSANGEACINDISGCEKYVSDMTDNARVFYQIFVGSFSDSDGDGIGDLQGIIRRFDYLNDGKPDSGLSLGVEGIWLSPIFKSPSYHKYDVTDYYTIDPDFGTMEDLSELVALCHERGVKLILDLPLNHTGALNRWFLNFCNARKTAAEADEYYDYYTVNDAPKLGGRSFSRIGTTEEYYESNFSSDMPELNYDNEAVRQAALDIGRYYLTEIGVDGFRFDAAKYIYLGETQKNVDFWSWYMEELRALKPDMYAVAEVWDTDSVTVNYEAALNCFDFTMAAVEGRISETTKRGDVNIFTAYVDGYINSVKAKNENAMLIPFIANHDMDRAAGYMTLASGYAKMAANLYILGPGSPIIYYGEEIALKGSRGAANTDANRRLAMLWGDGDTVKDPEGTTFDPEKQTNGTVASQLGAGDSLYSYYKRLIMIRKANPEIASGKYTALKLKDTRLGGFVSELNGKKTAVFHNTTGSAITIDLTEATGLSFGEMTACIGIDEEGSGLEGSVLTLGEQTSAVISVSE